MQYTEKVVVPVRCVSILCKYACRLRGTCFYVYDNQTAMMTSYFALLLACYSTSGPLWQGEGGNHCIVQCFFLFVVLCSEFVSLTEGYC